MNNTRNMPGLLAQSLDAWRNMSDDDYKDYDQLSPCLQEHIGRLAFYADRVPELLAALVETRKQLLSSAQLDERGHYKDWVANVLEQADLAIINVNGRTA